MCRFILELALKLGKTKAELLDGMSSLELTEWLALFQVKEEEAVEQKLERDATSNLGGLKLGNNS